MGEFISSVRKQIGEFLQKLSTKVKILLITGLVLIAAIAVILAVNLNKTNYTVLFSQLDAAEAGEILTLLTEMGVDARASGSDTILVPEGEAPALYMQMAMQGYPQTGLSYDFFESSTGFTTTDQEKQIINQYQTQEHINQAISTMDKVKRCIAIVNMASSGSYVLSSNSREARVAVTLELAEGEALSIAEAKAIGLFIMSAVSELKMENIQIIDTKANSYDLFAEENPAFDTSTQYELTEQTKAALKKDVTELLKKAFGEENISVSVYVQLNFDKEVSSAIEFAPPVYGELDGIVRSQEELYEAMREYYEDDGGQVGTDVNGVSAPDYIYDYELDEDAINESWQLTQNFEINETQTQLEKAQGYIEKLSVAVLINNSDANASYRQQVENLVARSLGIDEKYVAVEFLPFSVDKGIDIDETIAEYQRVVAERNQQDLIRTVIIALAVLLLAFMVLRFFKKPAPVEAEGYIIDEDGNLVNINIDDEFMAEYGDDELGQEEENALMSAMSAEKPNMVREIESFVENYPEAAAQILRNWLTEDF